MKYSVILPRGLIKEVEHYMIVFVTYHSFVAFLYPMVCAMFYIFTCTIYRDVSGCRIVGSPRCIDDKKYARNAYIFNFVFVFTSSTATTAYEPIITKIGDTFKTCEVRK